MNKQNAQDDGSDSNKRRHGDDVTASKIVVGGPGEGGPQKKSRVDSPPYSEVKEGSDSSSSYQVTNSALSILQEATAKGTEELQALVSQPAAAAAKKQPDVPTVEVEGVTFPERLMELVMNETDKQALWWLPDGKTFAIHSKRFSKTILAKNFQGSKFESFTRKLARWGFKRLSGPDIPPHTFVFEHPYFQRSRPELAKEISGSKKKQPPPPPAPSADESGMDSLGASSEAGRAQAGPAPAPWPSFADAPPPPQQQPVESSRAGPAGLYDDMVRQALLQQGLTATGAARQSGTLLGRRQSDLENRLLLQSMIQGSLTGPSASESPSGRSHGQDAFLTATMLARQERARALAAAAAAAPAPSTSSASAGDLASSLNLPNLTATSQLRRSLSSGYPIPSFASDPSTLPGVFQQHQLPSGRLPTTSAASATLDPLVRLYLQQQEANRQESFLLQQEALRQEIRRRERQQNRQDPPHEGGGPR